MSFVKAKGRRGIGGTELVWAVERGLKKKYSLRKSEVVVTGTREQWL